jgi:hypothetical protein
MQYKDRASAEAAALAELRQRARRERTLSYSFPGRSDVLAECIVEMQGFREGVAGQWLVMRAEHYIGPDGYRCAVEAEQPNSASTVQKVSGTKIDDQVQESLAFSNQSESEISSRRQRKSSCVSVATS